MNKHLRVAVVGGGIGGTTLAIMLQRAGYCVDVYEQAPAFARIGAGISLGPNVLKVMRAIGLADRFIEVGTMARLRLSREWDTGRILNEVRYADFKDLYGEIMISMHRGDMLQILHEAIEPGSTHFSKRAIGIETAPAGTYTVRFADGTHAEADLIVGADGVNSVIREILLGVEAPIYTGFVAYRSIVPLNRLGGFRPKADHTKWWTTETFPNGEDRHFITYYLTKERDELYFVTGSPAPVWDASQSSAPADLGEIRDCYAGFHEEVQRVISASPGATKWPLLERRPFTLWSRDSIVLLGDACHPMKPHMGQGAGMAIEDAAILFRSLTGSSDIGDALRIYALNRQDRTAQVQDTSRKNTWFKYPADVSWVYGYDATRTPLLT